MDNEHPDSRRPLDQGRSAVTSSPTSASARQLARHKGLAWVSALTLGAGAASALGAVAIAATLPIPNAAASASPASTAPNTAPNVIPSGDGNDGGTQPQQARLQRAPKAATLKAAAAPTTAQSPPVATSGAS